MRGTDLLEKLNLVSLEYIQNAAEPPVRKYKLRRTAVTAACIAAIVGGSWYYLHPNIYVSVVPSTGSSSSTSEKYHSLDELLEYLSDHDAHNGWKGAKYLSPQTNGLDTGHSESIMYQNYIYHFNYRIDKHTEGLQIFNLKENAFAGGMALKYHNTYTGQLFIYQNNLILVRDSLTETKTFVEIYSLENPEKPQLKHQFTQNGTSDTAFISDNKFYLFTSDGACACGFSDKADLSEYKPLADLDGNVVEWSDDEIDILGEPERVFYTAVSVIDLQTTEILQKRAFYGDIEDIYIDKDIISLCIQKNSNHHDKPKIYTFNMSENFSYISKITVNTLGTAEILDMKKIGNSYKIICKSYHIIGLLATSEIIAISADIQSGEYFSNSYFLENLPSSIDHFIEGIVWNDNIAEIAIEKRHADWQYYRLAVNFNDNNISFAKTDKTQPFNRSVRQDGVLEYGGKKFYSEWRNEIFEYDGKQFYIDYQNHTLETVQ